MVFVTVRQDESDDVVEARLDRLEVGQDQVDTRLVLFGEEHTAVDDEELALVLEDGHVATDLAEAAEREDAQGALFEGGRMIDVRGHAASRMCAPRHPIVCCCGVRGPVRGPRLWSCDARSWGTGRRGARESRAWRRL